MPIKRDAARAVESHIVVFAVLSYDHRGSVRIKGLFAAGAVVWAKLEWKLAKLPAG